jgi:hypothetical protein
MATLLILLELDDSAPLKTLNTLKELPGVVDVHMGAARTSAEVKRFVRGDNAPAEKPAARAAAAPVSANGLSSRQIVMHFLATNRGASYSDCAAELGRHDREPKGAGATLTQIVKAGQARRPASGGYELTAKGTREVQALAMNGSGTRAGKFGNDAVLAHLREKGGSSDMPAIFALAKEYGQTNEHASAAVGRLVANKLVTAVGKRGQRTITLKE